MQLVPVNGSRHTINVPPDLVDRVPEFRARVIELYPSILEEPHLSVMGRIVLNDDELRALLENPDGPRLMWHFVSRAVAGFEP